MPLFGTGLSVLLTASNARHRGTCVRLMSTKEYQSIRRRQFLGHSETDRIELQNVRRRELAWLEEIPPGSASVL